MLLAEPQPPASWSSRDTAVARKLASVSILVFWAWVPAQPLCLGLGQSSCLPSPVVRQLQ